MGMGECGIFKRWLGLDDAHLIEQMQGPILELNSPISRNAKVLLKIFANLILGDPLYVERVKKHHARLLQRIAIAQRHRLVLQMRDLIGHLAQKK